MPLNKNMSISDMVRELMRSYKKTKKIGSNHPKNKKDALKQALAIAYATKKDEDLKNKPDNAIINNMIDNIKNNLLKFTNCEHYSDILSKFGKDTPHFMMDKIKEKLERRGYSVDYEDNGDKFHIILTKNNRIVKELDLVKIKVAANEITDRDII